MDTTHTGSQIRRRRECGLCEQRFSTVEILVKDRQRTSTKDLVMLPEGVIAALTGS